jgi:hypothetical protein
MNFIDICGWSGMFFILLSYFLITTERVTGKSLSYVVLNFMASFLFCIQLYSLSVWSGFTLNLIWVCLSFYGIFNSLGLIKRNTINKDNQENNQ